jgi:hypothetical protein
MVGAPTVIDLLSCTIVTLWSRSIQRVGLKELSFDSLGFVETSQLVTFYLQLQFWNETDYSVIGYLLCFAPTAVLILRSHRKTNPIDKYYPIPFVVLHHYLYVFKH